MRATSGWPVGAPMLRLLALALAWLLWSGHYTIEEPLIRVFGAASCVFVLALYYRMRAASVHGRDRTLHPLKVVAYIPWLLIEIVKSNLAVARIVLARRMPISPCIVKVRASQRGETARVLYANSITLTPGTISLDLRGDTIFVHAITKGIADDLIEGTMDRKVASLESES